MEIRADARPAYVEATRASEQRTASLPRSAEVLSGGGRQETRDGAGDQIAELDPVRLHPIE